MKVKDIANYFEELAPLSYQESYDNAGLIVGNYNTELNGVLISLDVTEDVVDEAVEKGCNLIVAHHPVIFAGLKKLTGRNYVERTVIKAIKNDISIYAAHTNLDSVFGGVNSKICEKIGLQDCRVLSPMKDELMKLVCYIPVSSTEIVRKALFEAGAGHIGNYDQCSYSGVGHGSFRAGEGTKPFIGEKGKLHIEEESRLETVFPRAKQSTIIRALKNAHPYEEVAYDIYRLENKYAFAGIGMIGKLENPLDEKEFLQLLKNKFETGLIKHTNLLGRKVSKVAVCGGTGSFLLRKAISAGADFFVSADFKYHEYFDAENKIVIADIGHYESEQYTKEVFYELLTKKFPKFATCLSEVKTNPVSYF